MAKASHVQRMLKPGVRDVLGGSVERAAREHLAIETGRVRSGKIFTVELPLEQAQVRRFAEVLADPVQHDVFVDSFLDDPSCGSYLVVARRPGVTDDEGASAQRVLSSLAELPADGRQRVFAHGVYYFERVLSPEQLRRIGEELLGNPLVDRFQSGSRLDALRWSEARSEKGGRVLPISLEVSDDALLSLSRERVLSLSLEEMKAIRAHFAESRVREGRRELGLPESPTDCELEILAQTWSEHCKHKEFNALVRYRDLDSGECREIDSLFETFIRAPTEEIARREGASWIVKVFSDNAGVVRVDDERLFVFKVETHNSPSALDPYGGALTGIVGVNRDPLGTGRGGARLLFNTDVLCFGPPDWRRPLLPGQLHPSRVFAGVRKGIEDGGNKSGIPTIGGALVFDERFAGKPLVFCGTGAVMPAQIAGRPSWEKEIVPGDAILMVGGRVGKDGIHGATFSSAGLDPESPRSAVQIGSPITQKLLADFLEKACAAGFVRGLTDNGAGGLSSSVGELATLSGGARLELERVPLKYDGLDPWEILVSESQERMTLAVPEEHLAALLELARRMDVEATCIGVFTDDGFFQAWHEGRAVARLPLDFLHDGVPRKTLEAEWKRPSLREPSLEISDHGEQLLRLLASWDICSRERVVRQFDHEVKGRTVVKPLMGPRGKAPQDASVMRLDFDSWVGVAVAHGIAPRYGDLDPYEMSAGALDEAIRQLVAVGARLPDRDRPHGFWSANDNFCVPDSVYDPVANPDGKEKLGKLVRMCEALRDMSSFFGVPMTSGKDSMKNDFRAGEAKISVPPTVLYSVVARIDDVRRCVTSELKAEGDLVYLVGKTYDELGGSQLYRLHGELGASVPRVRKAEAKERYRRMGEAHQAGLLESCHDLSDGGLAVALAEAAFGGGLGFELSLPEGLSPTVQLFSESHSRFVVSVREENRSAFEALFGEDCALLGKVGGERARIRAGGARVVDLAVDELLRAWERGLEGYA